MITGAFDLSRAIIEPVIDPDAPAVDACIVTFSHEIEEYVTRTFDCAELGRFWFATGSTPVYAFDWNGRRFAFYRTCVGAPACVGTVEESLALIRTKEYVVFGGAGGLDRAIAHGKVMLPDWAWRDEGTSYHYAPASDTIPVKNAGAVAKFMEENRIPHVRGGTWTTDAFYREMVISFEKRRAQGCISVEMECAALQAMCGFRGLELYMFFTSGDLLDVPEWDPRNDGENTSGTQHDPGHFRIALELAGYVCDH